MSAGLAHDFKEQVRANTDLVALIGESITLQPRRGGREYVGLCPFHDDHNPSMTVSPERQSYKCWSCQEGGDCYSWVMKTDGLAFPEALRLLAERAGLEMPAKYQRDDGNRQSKQTLYDVLSWAEGQFHEFLMTAQAAKPAREYLAERGFSEESLRRFRVGYHPDNWTWLLDRAKNRFSTEQLLSARLASERRSGDGYVDQFVNRVMFPVRDERGRVVAFGGRVLPAFARENDPKYINSADSPVFSKSRLLYGLDSAREAIRQRDEAVVVEGYTDCMMVSQHGVENVVATLGTSLTELHVQLLKRFARKVVLVFDGDDAGKAASDRSLGKFLAQEIDLRILTLPPKQDPADYLEQHGADAFRELTDNAVEAWEHKLNTAIETHTLETIDARHRVLDEMLELLAEAPRLSGSVREDLILSRLSRIVRLPERTIRQELTKKRRQPANAGTVPSPMPVEEPGDAPDRGSISSRDEQLESDLLEMIFADPPIMERVAERISVEEFRHAELQHVFQVCVDLWEQEAPPEYHRVMAVLEDPTLKRLATEIDDLARRKNTAEKLRAAPAAQGVPPPATLFDEVMSRFEWRRRVKAAPLPEPHVSVSSGMTTETKDRLRQLTELRQADPHHRLKPRTGRKR